MQPDAILGALEKINDRLGSVEQNLQHQTTRIDALPTRDELDARLDTLRGEFEDRVAALPTRDEFEARLAALPTRDEFEARLAALPTRDELEIRVAGLPTREELKQEHLETRGHIDARFEEVHRRFKILAEGYEHVSDKLDKVHEDLKKDIAGVDRRVMKLEVHTGLIGRQK
ncbi:MAG: hypothetical protein GEV06_21925 [Luteitalea sp.]|nr:hypothetical protein [Luteitalea sp.]